MPYYEVSKSQFITIQSENHLPNELEEEYKIGVTDVKNLKGFRINFGIKLNKKQAVLNIETQFSRKRIFSFVW